MCSKSTSAIWWRVGKELHAGPLQLAALALLKVDALSQPPGQLSQMSTQRASDIEAMRKALTQCLRQIRALSASLAPSELAGLSFAETLGTAICCTNCGPPDRWRATLAICQRAHRTPSRPAPTSLSPTA